MQYPKSLNHGEPPGMRCDWCGRETPANYVHGHIQCVHCHRNIAPCCEGEVCAPEGRALGNSAD